MITKLKIVEQLNKLLLADRALTEKLVNTRHQVSDAYINLDEFVYMQQDNEPPNAGMIGVLNGLVSEGANDQECIAANYDDDMKLIGFLIVKV